MTKNQTEGKSLLFKLMPDSRDVKDDSIMYQLHYSTLDRNNISFSIKNVQGENVATVVIKDKAEILRLGEFFNHAYDHIFASTANSEKVL